MFRYVIMMLLLGWSVGASALAIESVTLMLDDQGLPGEEVESFAPSDRIQHFAITLDDTQLGNRAFLVEFWAVETSAGSDRKVSQFEGGALVANTLKAKVSLPRDWPTGSYRLDVKMDGELIGSYDYEIAEP